MSFDAIWFTTDSPVVEIGVSTVIARGSSGEVSDVHVFGSVVWSRGEAECCASMFHCIVYPRRTGNGDELTRNRMFRRI